MTLAVCGAQGRRAVIALPPSTQAPIAGEGRRRITDLDRLAEAIRGRPADARGAVRRDQSKPLVAALTVSLEEPLARFANWMRTMVRNYLKRVEDLGQEPDADLLMPIVEIIQSLENGSNRTGPA